MARSPRRTKPTIGDTIEPAGNDGSETIVGPGEGNGAGSENSGADNGAGSPEVNAAPGATDPQEVGAEAPKKRRGRPPGSGAKPKPAPDAGAGISEEDATRQVAGLYAMFAALSQEPAFHYGVENAATIGREVANVSRYYNMSIDGPVLSLVKLGAAVAMVNVPIIAAISGKHRAARAARAAQPATPEDVVFAAGNDGTQDRPTVDLTGETLAAHFRH